MAASSESGEINLRIAWYETPDGTSSQIATDDSESIHSTDWHQIQVVAQAPEQAKSAKIRIMLSTSTAPYYIDLIELSTIQPTATPPPTPTNTPKPSPTKEPTSTPTSRPTPTPSSLSPTDSNNTENLILGISNQDLPTTTRPGDTIRNTTNSTYSNNQDQPFDETGSPSSSQDKIELPSQDEQNLPGKILIISGIGLTMLSGVIYHRYQSPDYE